MLLKYGVSIDKNEYGVTLVVPISWSLDDVEKATQILFENLNVPALYLLDEPLGILYAAGAQTGLVVDIGHHTTDITPIYDNTPIQTAKISIPLGGADINELLCKLWPNKLSPATLAKVKKEACVVSINPEKLDSAPKSFSIDGQSISIGISRSKCCEVLFNPQLVGKSCMSVPEAIYHSVCLAVEPARRTGFYENVVLAGGCSELRGISERLDHEMRAHMFACSETANEYQAKELKYVRVPDYMAFFKDRPSDSAFLGGTIAGKLALGSSGGVGYISKADYNMYGPSVASMK